MVIKNAATIDNIGGGIAPELFKKGLERVLNNISDPATSARKERKIAITFTFKPDEERLGVEIDVSMSTTLAQIGSKKAMAYLSKDNEEKLHMTTSNPINMELFEQLEQAKAGNE